MGERGPAPKRSDMRVRRNKENEPEKVVVSKIAPEVKAPAEDPKWHISAKRWYRSLKKSGQAIFYEPSDWAYAQLAADLLTIEMTATKPRAVMISRIQSMMDNLMTSEGARRRLRLELIREGASGGDDGNAPVIPISLEAMYGGSGP